MKDENRAINIIISIVITFYFLWFLGIPLVYELESAFLVLWIIFAVLFTAGYFPVLNNLLRKEKA